MVWEVPAQGPEEGSVSGGTAGAANRLFTIAALEQTVAGEAVAVAGEIVRHLLLPGIDEPDLLVVAHVGHADEQTDVLAGPVVVPQQVEDSAVLVARSAHALIHKNDEMVPPVPESLKE